MNKRYNSIFNKNTQTYVAVSERARKASKTKNSLNTSLILAALASTLWLPNGFANTCAPAAVAGGTVTCTAAGAGTGGISYTVPITLNLDGITNGAMSISTTGTTRDVALTAAAGNQNTTLNLLGNVSLIATGTGYGIYLQKAATTTGGNITLNTSADSSINTAVTAVLVEQRAVTTGAAGIAIVNAADITTTGAAADGIFAQIYAPSNTGDINITHAQGATITTIGANSRGIRAWTSGLGNVDVSVAGTINSKTATGVWGRIGNASSTAKVILTLADTGVIIVSDIATGGTPQGLHAVHLGLGAVEINSAGSIFVEAPTSGNAANGIYSNVNNVLNVGSTMINMTGGRIETNGFESAGIFAETTGLGLIDIAASGNIITNGSDANGLYGLIGNATNNSALNVRLTASGAIQTVGNTAHGIYAEGNGVGAVDASSFGSIVTNGADAHGVVARVTAAGSATASMFGGTVTVNGDAAEGVFARSNLAGSATAQQTGGTITTNGVDSEGIVAFVGSLLAPGSGNALARQTGGSVITNNTDASGMLAQAFGTGNATVEQGANGQISTNNTLSHGIQALTTTGNIFVDQLGIIATTGAMASGIFTQQLFGTASTTINAGGTVSAIGADASGINATMSSTGTFAITVDGSNTITAGTGTGAGIKTTSGATGTILVGQNATINGAASGNSIIDGVAATSATIAGTLAGGVNMGAGNDALIITETGNVSGTVFMNGDNNTDTLTLRGQTLSAYSAAANTPADGINLTNWETINLNNGTSLTLTKNLDVSALGSGGVLGDVNIDATSRFNVAGAGGAAVTQTLNGNLNNAGLVYFNSLNTILSVAGNYVGTAGSTVNLETKLGDDASETDKLWVVGNTSGTSNVIIRNAAGTGAQTTVGIDVIQVDGTSAASSFTMAAPVTAGAYEYILKQGGNGAADTNDWYLISTLIPVAQDPIPLFRPAVAGYIAGQHANMQNGFNQIGTLHQRMGEQRHANLEGDDTDKQLWMRLTGSKENANGHHRFDYVSRDYGIQVGADIVDTTTASGNQQRAGVMVNYNAGHTSFADNVRKLASLDSDTGNMSSKSVGIGAYYTNMSKEGTYLDLVANVNRLRNSFNDAYAVNATQHGWQSNLSAEIGKPIYETSNHWHLEPQAQLIYQYTHYNGFNDDISKIKGYNTDNLRGRLGVRMFKDDETTERLNNYYLTANLIHDFMGTENIHVSDARLKESYDKTSAEIVVGAQSRFTNNLFFYTNAKYHYGLQGNSEGGQADLGLKYEW